jgi:hypothetical protein
MSASSSGTTPLWRGIPNLLEKSLLTWAMARRVISSAKGASLPSGIIALLELKLKQRRVTIDIFALRVIMLRGF